MKNQRNKEVKHYEFGLILYESDVSLPNFAFFVSFIGYTDDQIHKTYN